ncbi:amidase [Sphaerotilus mobilis]|uniref:Amidase/aspartyl-tRNA(Asn)/glutamyl-tRNA(Gln) amidotransferase subunit A n=1 Tax=Sphaerotilus mobilis TaxID=47994 RepID=A0A4V2EX88_9BURK|nr:amidase [Sphaerotilus mobilis]RZS58640.1 amidase/aspartyl-tRNA(Asn)/glutamyl-tRNA(Gln) amidotransferase subunit A [Sphaerotilus mobilis]
MKSRPAPEPLQAPHQTDPSRHMDLLAARASVQARHTKAVDLLDGAARCAESPEAACAHVLIDLDSALAAAQQADAKVAAGTDPGALAGLSISVKDLFDVRGQVTRAGSTWLNEGHAAVHDAAAVARLRAAGAALIGRTQMTEFAFSGVGLNPHTGTPANVALSRLGLDGRAPGGSTSGGAVSVASGASWAALGSDTGGSLRIPAALHGLVGFKCSQHRVPLAGSVPLAPSFDTVGAITRSVRDAIVLHEVLGDRRVNLPGKPLRGLRLGWTRRLFLDALEPAIGAAWQRSLDVLAAAGADLVPLDLAALDDVPRLTDGGGITAAEAWAWHAPQLDARADAYDPRVLSRILRGRAIDASQLAALRTLRADWITRLSAQMADVDLMLAPTVARAAPPIADLQADDTAFFDLNAALLRNPAVINLFDGCALSLPAPVAANAAPVGLMLWAGRDADDRLLDAALAIEVALRNAVGGSR